MGKLYKTLSEDLNKVKPMTNAERPACGPVGITKREYYAGVAMQGLVDSSPSVEELCEMSIKIADELLKQLNHDPRT